MAITVRLPSGVTLEAVTEADLRLILSVVNSGPKSIPAVVDASASFAERLGKLPKLLRSDAQMATVQHLVANADGLTDEQLCTLVGLHSNRELAGVLSGIAKNFRKLGVEFADVLIRRVNKTPEGRRWYRYALTPAAREILAPAVPELPEPEHVPTEEEIPF